MSFESLLFQNKSKNNKILCSKDEEYLDYIQSVGFPNRKQESWKYLNLEKIKKTQWVLQDQKKKPLNKEDIKEIEKLKITNAIHVVFVNGVYIPQISSEEKDTSLFSIYDKSKDSQRDGKNHSEKRSCFNKKVNYFSAFVLLSSEEVISFEVKKNTKLKKILQIIHWQNGDSEELEERLFRQRINFKIEEGAELKVIETIDQAESQVRSFESLSLRVIDVQVGKRGCFDLCRVHKSKKIKCINHIRVEQEEGSQFYYLGADIQGELIRNDISVSVNGRHCETSVDGFYLTKDNQEIDNHAFIEQRSPDCKTHQLYKGFLTDKSHAVFDGKIVIQEKSQKVNVQQLNRNLLIGSKSRVDTKPNLEVLADDVKASHGATVGQLNEEELFYFQSRAISKKKALEMIGFGFLVDVSYRLRNLDVRVRVEEWMRESFKGLV